MTMSETIGFDPFGAAFADDRAPTPSINALAGDAYALPAVDEITIEDREAFEVPDAFKDDRSFAEKAFGWIGTRIENKINNIVDNPGTSLINTATGFVPGLNFANTLSLMVGGPTVGSIAAGVGKAISEGRVDPVTADNFYGFDGSSDFDYNWQQGRIRYFRTSDGKIITKSEEPPKSEGVLSGV